MAIKNLWSLQIDEAIVANEIKERLKKDCEVFSPINSQLRDIDLLVYNPKTGKTKSVQVKGSRSFDWDVNEQRSWHIVKRDSIFKPKNKVDFFIFVWHIVHETKTKRSMKQAYLVIPINDFKKKLKKKTLRKDKTYHFSFWTDLKNKASDGNNSKYNEIDFSEFLDRFDLLKK